MACADARVIIDLAMQRHWDDDLFRQRFLAQPCSAVLVGRFSEESQNLLRQAAPCQPALAEICQKEIQRLQQSSGQR
jgi:hypothetical protein